MKLIPEQKITCCKDCMCWYEDFIDGTDRCANKEMGYPIDDIDTIPSWCPLPNAKEGDEE